MKYYGVILLNLLYLASTQIWMYSIATQIWSNLTKSALNKIWPYTTESTQMKFGRFRLRQPQLKFDWVDFDWNSAKSASTEFSRVGRGRNLAESVSIKIWSYVTKFGRVGYNQNLVIFSRVGLDQNMTEFSQVGPCRNLAETTLTQIWPYSNFLNFFYKK